MFVCVMCVSCVDNVVCCMNIVAGPGEKLIYCRESDMISTLAPGDIMYTVRAATMFVID
jgi:hypothetical protein